MDEQNPEARLSLKDFSCLVCDYEQDPPEIDLSSAATCNYLDVILKGVIQRWGSCFTKNPFQHETLLVEGKESKLSKAEKRMAQRLYEKAKQDGNTQYRRQSYSAFYPKIPIPPMDSFNRPPFPTANPGRSQGGIALRPSALNQPIQGLGIDMLAEALAQGKLVCKEMILTKDVTIARNVPTAPGSSGAPADTSPIVLPSGTKVKLIKTPKGIYMQTPEGKIFRIHSSAPASPASPSAIAAALGVKAAPTFASAAGPAVPGQSPYVDPSVVKRIRGSHFF